MNLYSLRFEQIVRIHDEWHAIGSIQETPSSPHMHTHTHPRSLPNQRDPDGTNSSESAHERLCGCPTTYGGVHAMPLAAHSDT